MRQARAEGDQFFWDFRVAAAADFFIQSVVNTTLNEYIDGSFTDDVTGLPAEHAAAIANMRLSIEEVTAIQKATQDTSQRLIEALVAQKKYNWQAFGAQDGVGPAPSQADCTTFMRTRCTPGTQQWSMTMQLGGNQSLAAFLVLRPPVRLT